MGSSHSNSRSKNPVNSVNEKKNQKMQQNYLNNRQSKELPGQNLKNKYAGIPSKIGTGKAGAVGRPPIANQ